MQRNKKRRKHTVRRIILLVLLLAVLAGAVWQFYRGLKKEYTVNYDSYTASVGSIANALSFSGNINAVDSTAYTASAQADVRTVFVQAGDAVHKNDKLLRLSNGTTVQADFDGRVNVLNVKAGDCVNPGDALVQVVNFNHLKVTFRIDEYDIGSVSVGDACTVTVTATEKKFDSTIATIDFISSSNGNVAYYTATAYVDVEDGAYPGMQATVSVVREQAENAVILKADALSFDETNSAYVWMRGDDGEMTQVPVEVGVSNGNYVEILSGVKDGDEVYAVSKKTDEVTSPFAAIFGSAQINPQQGNMPGGSNRPDFANRGDKSSNGSTGNGSGMGGGQP